MSQTTRRVAVPTPKTVTIETYQVTDPGPGELLVRMTAAGICGSDVHAVAGEHPFVPTPYFPGHEVVGVVAATGPGTSWHVGERVVVNPLQSCGRCRRCRQGARNLCAAMAVFGCTVPAGGMTEYFLIAEQSTYRIPDSVPELRAVLVEPLATPVHALRLSQIPLEQARVVILGAGTIGLLTLALARHFGADTVVVTDLAEDKRDRAIRLGASAAYHPAEPGLVERLRGQFDGPPDLVIDCVATQQTVDQAIRLALKGGTTVVVGVPSAPVRIPLPELQDQQSCLRGSALYEDDDFSTALDLVSNGAIDLETFVSAQYPLADAAAAFAAAAEGDQVKTVLIAD